jgi:hypothetical protein
MFSEILEMREHFRADKEILSVVFISVMKGMRHVGNVAFQGQY